MLCCWDSLLTILPLSIRTQMEPAYQTGLREIRLRCGSPPMLCFAAKSVRLTGTVREQDLTAIINLASRYSPWATQTMSSGYLTAAGGHRIGICGEVVLQNQTISGFRHLSSLCIRIARDVPGAAERLQNETGSILIIGAPGWGKTTLLRDLIRQIGESEAVAVADERQELFPPGFERGKMVDVLSSCPKHDGLMMLLKTMNPHYIAVDEITEKADVEAICDIHGCGVKLLATAHAGSFSEWESRTVYLPLQTHRVFQTAVILRADNRFEIRRLNPWK